MKIRYHCYTCNIKNANERKRLSIEEYTHLYILSKTIKTRCNSQFSQHSGRHHRTRIRKSKSVTKIFKKSWLPEPPHRKLFRTNRWCQPSSYCTGAKATLGGRWTQAAIAAQRQRAGAAAVAVTVSEWPLLVRPRASRAPRAAAPRSLLIRYLLTPCNWIEFEAGAVVALAPLPFFVLVFFAGRRLRNPSRASLEAFFFCSNCARLYPRGGVERVES